MTLNNLREHVLGLYRSGYDGSTEVKIEIQNEGSGNVVEADLKYIDVWYLNDHERPVIILSGEE